MKRFDSLSTILLSLRDDRVAGDHEAPVFRECMEIVMEALDTAKGTSAYASTVLLDCARDNQSHWVDALLSWRGCGGEHSNERVDVSKLLQKGGPYAARARAFAQWTELRAAWVFAATVQRRPKCA